MVPRVARTPPTPTSVVQTSCPFAARVDAASAVLVRGTFTASTLVSGLGWDKSI